MSEKIYIFALETKNQEIKLHQNQHFSKNETIYSKTSVMAKMYFKRRYNTDWIETFIHSDDAFQTREELQEWENDNWLCINWSVWDRVVEQTKRQIEEIKHIPVVQEKRYKKVYTYNYDGQLIAQYNSADEASERLNIKKTTIQYCCTQVKPYQTERLFFSYTPMDYQDVRKITQQYKRRKPSKQGGGHKEVEKWVYDSSTMKLLGHFKNSSEVALKFDIRPEAVNYYSWMDKPYKKVGLIIKNKPISG